MTNYYEVAKPAQVASELYPDVTAAGGLRPLLQACLQQAASALQATGIDPPIPGFPEYGRVEQGDRSCQVYIAAHERLFSSDFWAQGVCLAKGACSDPVELARAIDCWISQAPIRTDALALRFPFVRPSSDAPAFENGHAVEHRWTQYLESIDDMIPQLSLLMLAAAQRPALRQLFPYTSVHRLCFSRCTGFPYTGDCPMITPNRDGTFIVETPDGMKSPPLAADEAADWAAQHLPPGAGPAIAGTAAELDHPPASP